MSLDADLVAAALPSYTIGSELGRGGWGVVLAGRHRTLDRDVAIKQLPRAFAADPAVRSRFLSEARTLASVSHPHVVPVYDFVEHDGLCLLVMEALPGGTVWTRFLEHGYSAETSVAVAVAALAGLEAAHERGVLHRDVKPENLMYASDGVLKVTDFGIAKVVGGTRTMATRAGEVLGTPAYMAPEQAMGKELTPATDCYAVAVLLYELLAGTLPFPEEGDALQIVYRHVHEQPRPLSDVAPQVGPNLARTVMQGLAKAPDDRYRSAEDFAVAIVEAATIDLGPDWSERSGARVMATARVMSTTGSAVVVPASAPSTLPPQAGPAAAAPAAPPTIAPVGTPLDPPLVRPEVSAHHQGARADEVDVEALVPVAEASPRRSVVLPAVVALMLLTLAVAIGMVGPGAPETGGEFVAGEVTIAGVDATSGAIIPIDLDGTIPVEVDASLSSTPPAEVELRLTVLGVALGNSTAPLLADLDGPNVVADVDLSGSRFLVSGQVTAHVVLVDASGAKRSHRLIARPVHHAMLTVPAFVGVVALLLLGAYAESLIRSLRRGRHTIGARVGLLIVGAGLGLLAAVAGWVVGSGEPVVATLAPGLALGIGSGLAAGIAAGRTNLARRSA